MTVRPHERLTLNELAGLSDPCGGDVQLAVQAGEEDVEDLVDLGVAPS